MSRKIREKTPPKKLKEDELEIKEKVFASILEISEKLSKRMKENESLWTKITSSNCYSFDSLLRCLEENKSIWESRINHLQKIFPISNFDKCKSILKILIDCSVLKSIQEEKLGLEHSSFYFLAQKFPDVLNYEMEVTEKNLLFKHQNKKINEIAEEMRSILKKLYDLALNDKGTKVDYLLIQKALLFSRYKYLSYLLQTVEAENLSRDEKIAFFINIYNVLVIHGTICFLSSNPVNPTVRDGKFFSRISYKIGDFILSLDDIEHGILRANKGESI